jgi:hypothetical protein
MTRRLRVLLSPLLVLMMLACAGATSSAGVEEAAAPRLTEYDCRPPATAEAVSRASENFTKGNRFTLPQPGNDACEVLLALGLPSQTDRYPTASGQMLWYENRQGRHSIRITLDPSRTGRLGSHWLVDEVNW